MKTHGITVGVSPLDDGIGDPLHVVTITNIRYVGLNVYNGNTSQGPMHHTLSLHISPEDLESLVRQLSTQLAEVKAR